MSRELLTLKKTCGTISKHRSLCGSVAERKNVIFWGDKNRNIGDKEEGTPPAVSRCDFGS